MVSFAEPAITRMERTLEAETLEAARDAALTRISSPQSSPVTSSAPVISSKIVMASSVRAWSGSNREIRDELARRIGRWRRAGWRLSGNKKEKNAVGRIVQFSARGHE